MIPQEKINEFAEKFDVKKYLQSKNISGFHSPKGILLKSPFRADKNPSAIIFNDSKIYHDSGTGEKLTLLNFIMKLENCSFQTALNILSKNTFQATENTAQTSKTSNNSAKFEFFPLENAKLIRYAEHRGISEQTAKKYLSEGWKDGKFYYLAFLNDNGGYALRNDTKSNYSKINYGKGGVTTIRHNSDKVVIFEGFFDFLSWIEYMNFKGKNTANFNAIVLNSCVNLTYILRSFGDYAKIYLLLDNDHKGAETAEKIKKQYPDKVINLTPQFITGDNKDFNDFWLSHKKIG
jgi:DNA primase